MQLVDLIRHVFPSVYWSAGFIACLVCSMAISLVLYVVTRWPAWIITFASALMYCIPFVLFRQ